MTCIIVLDLVCRRYFILYAFGGIYLDLDTEFVRPILPYLWRGVPCVLSEEDPLQVGASWAQEFGVTNSFIICRARHPLFKVHNIFELTLNNNRFLLKW